MYWNVAVISETEYVVSTCSNIQTVYNVASFTDTVIHKFGSFFLNILLCLWWHIINNLYMLRGNKTN